MKNQLTFTALSFLLLLSGVTLTAGQDKLGKLFIKAAATVVDGQQVTDSELDDSVKDMKKQHGKFILVDTESEATYLIIVNERTAVPQAGSPTAKSILGTFYMRDGEKWKPVAKLKSRANSTFWGLAASDVIKSAEKWVKSNPGN